MKRRKGLLAVIIVAVLTLSILMTSCSGGSNSKPKQYTVTFDSNGGSSVSSQTVDEGGSITKPTNPTKGGYAFAGWYYSKSLTGDAITFPYTPASSTTLYAKWDADIPPTVQFIVTFSSNGGSSVSSQKVNEGGSITKPTDPTKSGYIFAGWYNNPSLTGSAIAFPYTPMSSMTLYAKWDADIPPTVQFTVSFNSNGGSSVSSQTIDEGNNITKPTDPTKSGYTFAGWYDNQLLTGSAIVFPYTPTSSITLYAKWGERYTVSFNSNGGNSISPQVVEEGDSAFEPTDPTRSGYTFAGWYDNPSFTGSTIVFPYTPTSSITLYAKWNERYTISFDSNGGSSVSPKVVEEGDSVFEPTDPTKSVHTFSGWYDNQLLAGNAIIFPYTPTSSITLYAKWKEQYTVSFDSNGGSSVSSQTVDEGDNVIQPASPTKSGYMFIGWYDNPSLTGNVIIFPYTPTSSITLYAKWSVQYTVSFNSSGGSSVPSQTVTEGGSVSKPTDPTKDGYAFSGWYDNQSCTGEAISFPYTPSSSITLYASWIMTETPASSFVYTVTNGKVTITGFNGNEKTILIPSTIEGYPVTGIGKSAFESKYLLISIIIPSSVVSIGQYAFYNCTSLKIYFEAADSTGITFEHQWNLSYCLVYYGVNDSTFTVVDGVHYYVDGSAVTVIGHEYRDEYRTDLVEIRNSITINGAEYGVTRIGDQAFYASSYDIAKIKLPDSLKSIGNYAFYNCSGFESIVIPDSVTAIGDYAFYRCFDVAITLPDNLISVGSFAFSACSDLMSITLPDSVTSIGENAFSGTGHYNNSSNWTGNLLYIGNHLIISKTSVSGGLTIREGTRTIADGAFRDCSSLTGVTIPGSVKSIGNDAFRSCSGLTSIEIPGNVTSIGSYAFVFCSGLSNVVIPDSVTSLGNDAFAYCINLVSFTIGSGITSLNSYTFEGCSKLASIVIPDSVNSIGEYVFRDCTNLASITIGSGVTSIGRGLILFCDNLTNISVKEGNSVYHSDGNCIIETASKTLMFGCNNSVIPDDGSVTSIKDEAFRGCRNLDGITIPNSVISIGNGVFVECSGLTSITIPDGVTSIGIQAFAGCTGLTNVTIGSGVKSIGRQAFVGCGSLTSVTFITTSGWYVTQTENAASGTTVSVTSASTSATRLNTTYLNYFWYRT